MGKRCNEFAFKEPAVEYRPTERYRDGNKADDTFPLLHVELTTTSLRWKNAAPDVTNLCEVEICLQNLDDSELIRFISITLSTEKISLNNY